MDKNEIKANRNYLFSTSSSQLSINI
jgi:hypothetical protein